MTLYTKQLQRKMRELSDSLDPSVDSDQDEFTADEINRLLRFNQRLAELELYLCDLGTKESAQLDGHVSDPNDPLDDYEIEATLYFILGEDDPDFDEDDDNFLTQRQISLKQLDRKFGLGDGIDHRVPYRHFPESLNEVWHCWLFYDLYENCYGLEQPSVTLWDCLRINSIWVDVAVRHQSTLDIKSSKWMQPIEANKQPSDDR